MDSRVRANEPAFFVSTKKRTRFPAGVVRRRESDVRERSEGNPSPTTILKFKTIANAMVFFCAKIQLARIIVLNLTKRRCSNILDRSI